MQLLLYFSLLHKRKDEIPLLQTWARFWIIVPSLIWLVVYPLTTTSQTWSLILLTKGLLALCLINQGRFECNKVAYLITLLMLCKSSFCCQRGLNNKDNTLHWLSQLFFFNFIHCELFCFWYWLSCILLYFWYCNFCSGRCEP